MIELRAHDGPIPAPDPWPPEPPRGGDPRAGAPDHSAFEALYREEWSGLVALGWTLTGSWARAEELAQDAFADAFRRWAEIGRLDRPGAWVRRALINRSASDHRRRDVEARGLARWSSTPSPAEHTERADADRTGELATSQVEDPAFWEAVRALPARQAQCVVLHYLEDRSVHDIAAVLGCRPATVKVHLHRGRHTLATRVTPPERHGRTTHTSTSTTSSSSTTEEHR
jgi:RNA polymerase sigma-70 factor (ECF subfamily)